MKDKSKMAVTDRRSFLKLASLGAVAGGVTLVAGKTAAVAAVEESAKDGHYTETEHVKTYYELARF